MKSLLSLLVVCGLTASTFALEIANLGKDSHFSGAKYTPERLRGKVVLIEHFGHGCGPCVSAMPHTVKLANDLKSDDRLVVLLSHEWGRNEGAINRFLKSTGAEQLPVYQALDIKGVAPVVGVPHARLFNHKGELIWEGHPGNGEALRARVEQALKEAPAAAKAKPGKGLERFHQKRHPRPRKLPL